MVFAWPHGLPAVLSGANAPLNPVDYAIITPIAGCCSTGTDLRVREFPHAGRGDLKLVWYYAGHRQESGGGARPLRYLARPLSGLSLVSLISEPAFAVPTYQQPSPASGDSDSQTSGDNNVG